MIFTMNFCKRNPYLFPLKLPKKLRSREGFLCLFIPQKLFHLPNVVFIHAVAEQHDVINVQNGG